MNNTPSLEEHAKQLAGRVDVLAMRLERAENWRDKMAQALAEAQDELRQVELSMRLNLRGRM